MLEPAPGARVIYVSADGDDAAPGTEAQPKRTLAAGYAELRDGEADWLLLRRGDVFTLTSRFTWAKSGPELIDTGTAHLSYMRLGAWGPESAPRPILDSGAEGALLLSPGFQSSKVIRRVAVTDIHLLASTRMNAPALAMSAPMAIQTLATQFQGEYPFLDLLFENLKIEGYSIGLAASSANANLRVRRSIFHYIFTLEGSSAGAFGFIGSPNGARFEENVFFRIQSDDIPGVGSSAYSPFLHSAYFQAEGRQIWTVGNFVIKATEAFMQRPGGVYLRNVGYHCRIAGLLGQAWGVEPSPGGVTVTMDESLLLNSFEEPFYIGNTAVGFVRNNLFLRDQNGADDVGLQLVPRNTTPTGGVNIGVHNTEFRGNVLSGTIDWDPNAGSSNFSGLTFSGNSENVGTVATTLGAYLASIAWSGSTADAWGERLIQRDRHNWSAAHETLSVINFYRARVGLPALQ